MSTTQVARLYLAALQTSNHRTKRGDVLQSHRDPGYARAYAGIAECDALLWMSGGTDMFTRKFSEQHHGVDIYAEPAEAHASRGWRSF
jgi:hypothetical protein